MSATLTSRKVLVLNKNWTPIATVTLEDAISKVASTYKDNTPKAKIIEPETYQLYTWDDWSKLRPKDGEDRIFSPNTFFKIPEIILLSRYEKMPKDKVHFSRRTLYKRDKMTCQYCGARPGSEELTIDHVVPRAKGGTTTWENVALCCVDCNRKKADRTPKQAGMKLLSEPKKPDASLFRFDVTKPVKSWGQFLDLSYWNVDISE